MCLITLLLLLNFGCKTILSGDQDEQKPVIVEPTDPEGLLVGNYQWTSTEIGYASCDPNSTPDYIVTPQTNQQAKRLELNNDFSYSEITTDFNADPDTVLFEESGFWYADEDTITFNYGGIHYIFSYSLSTWDFTKWYSDCENDYWIRYNYRKTP
jgi:hypothetical protein